MTPLMDNANRVLDAIEEGQVIMLLSLLPLAYEEEIKDFGLEYMFRAILTDLDWSTEDIDYWAQYFNLTEEEEVDMINT